MTWLGYNTVGMPRAPRARVEQLQRWSSPCLAAYCDQLRAAPMSNDTLFALLRGMELVTVTRNRREASAA